MADFTGKNILVLGGSRGIGAAIVRRFAKEGGKIAFTYAGSKDAAEALSAETGAEAIRTDSADRDALIATVASRGALDILVANAGALIAGDPLTLEANAIDHMIDVNVRAPITPRSRLRARCLTMVASS
jgi:cyclic-di-GMP-binding biofilm dispersal mediator protein